MEPLRFNSVRFTVKSIRHGQRGRGFTLVEVLLSVVILLALLGALAVSFSGAREGAELEEGAARFETLLRLARAHAANTGRRVRVAFSESQGEVGVSEMSSIHVEWEADPFAGPGRYGRLSEPGWNVDVVNELVGVARVLPLAGGEVAPAAEVEGGGDIVGGLEDLASLRPVTFFPDGSSDSARVVLASRAPDDRREVLVRVDGITGDIRREILELGGSELNESDEDEEEVEWSRP